MRPHHAWAWPCVACLLRVRRGPLRRRPSHVSCPSTVSSHGVWGCQYSGFYGALAGVPVSSCFFAPYSRTRTSSDAPYCSHASGTTPSQSSSVDRCFQRKQYRNRVGFCTYTQVRTSNRAGTNRDCAGSKVCQGQQRKRPQKHHRCEPRRLFKTPTSNTHEQRPPTWTAAS